MNPSEIALNKEDLHDQLLFQLGESRGGRMSKENFLRTSWEGISSFVKYNKSNALVQRAVKALPNGDLIPRAYLILSMQYGSYSVEPYLLSVLKDFIELLDKDMNEEELRICEYAKGKRNTFFPEIHDVWMNIREVYGAEEFSLSVLPPTPYYAYSLLALNRHEDILARTSGTKLFGEMAVLQHQMKGIAALATPNVQHKK